MTLYLPDGSLHVPSGKAEVQAKAATGPGVGFVLGGNPMLSSRDQTPQAIMRRAQMAYHSNQWVGLAESVVTRKVVGLPWHFEDANDEEYSQDKGGQGVPMPPEVQAARTLLERPQFVLPPDARQPATSTYRLMMSLTTRHVGLCGMAHWYGDRIDSRGVPMAWLYVNPARMWAETDANGNLTGWMLDATAVAGDGQPYGGLHFDLAEILTFYLDPPDHGHYGTGVYERAVMSANLSRLADQHASYVLSTGGRIAGIISPKEGTIPDENFKTLVAEFRNVNESPDAAKRTTILQGPTDFTPTAADPSELQLEGLSKMTRDNILANWQVPPTQAGIAPEHGGGLNSGQTKSYDEAILMQGAVHDRVLALKEALQYGWLDRYAPTIIELEFEEPTFDDDAPAYDLLAKSVSLPMTNEERRAIVGLPPFGDDRDKTIVLPLNIVPAFEAPTAPPMPPPPPGMLPPTEPGKAATAAVAPLAAGMHRSLVRLRANIERTAVPHVQTAVEKVLEDQRQEIIDRVRANISHIVAKPNDDAVWWNEAKWDKKMREALKPGMVQVAEATASHVADTLT